ncbi:MAG: AmmeMemoRadiSam system protein A [Candidatus Jettenia sp.]|nr:AmmeMemoRadiSam system protein A [Candidatus Jettenia sp.]
MDSQAKKILLQIARKQIEAAAKQEPMPFILCDHSDLQGREGAFVTLRTHGELRGCIGRFISDIPLYQLISELAISSATEDFRFESNRIKLSELTNLEIEISIVSELKPIKNPFDFELGKHGIFIKRGDQIGCLLPQVAVETGWNKAKLLSYCCSGKANLPSDAWKSKDIEIFTFTVEIIEEKEIKESS